MAETLPYMQSTGLVGKILDAIKSAKTPDRFSQDFLGTVLGFPSGSAKPFISLGKRLSLINSDGTPSDLYKRFRGSVDESKVAMAEAIRTGYAPLYKRNEFADQLDKKKLEGLVKEVTGAEEGSSTLRAIVGTFEALKPYADFTASGTTGGSAEPPDNSAQNGADAAPARGGLHDHSGGGAAVRFGYTININLPNTSDIAVFNSIFKALKDHLL
ncbi:DUF5343 domain-containing protein [Microbacterium hominis]|uniref:DUF5343 domain-containing protein n=1 Tax=Microbacterium hominis TaxID=162426 RepID=A0A0B4CRC5_9MICO|nr:DUF5343 domain-containing protein [Microbacterium hominis]KIC56946.1 hypothetical protein RM52_11775 [Microbacterium hominis]